MENQKEKEEIILANKANKVVHAALSVVKEKLEKKVDRRTKKRFKLKGLTLNKLIFSPKVKNAIDELISSSSMPEASKDFFKSMFGNNKEKRKIVRAILGDEQNLTNLFYGSVMTDEQTIKFVNLMKSLLLQLSPLATIRIAEIMLDKNTPVDTALKAAKDIMDRAGLSQNQSPTNNLPVNIVIKVPKDKEKNQINTQVNIITKNESEQSG